jgi:TolB-like protein/Tfp pilus assembly protein PilF
MNLFTSDAPHPEGRTPLTRRTFEQFPAPEVLRPGSKRTRLLTALLILVVVIAMGFGFWNLSRRLAPQLISSQTAAVDENPTLLQQKGIAVLPFENLSENNNTAFLADGVQGDILSVLSKLAELKVISRTSVNSYPAGARRNLREIAQTLGVAYVVEGSVWQAGGHVRINVQLRDTHASSQVWAQTYERDLADVFAIQSEIVRQILSQLQVNVSAKDQLAVAERPTKDLTAYGLYVRAQGLIATVSLNAQIDEKLREAVKLLEQAIARDPDFYLAYCGLSAAHDYLYFFGLDHTPARFAAADAALTAVVRLRPDAGETHLARANFLYRCHLDYEHARVELALAQHSLPNNSEIFELIGYIDRRQGLWNESARSLQRALELDPRNCFMLQQIALSYQEFRQFTAMAAALDRALALMPRDRDTRLTRALVDLEWKADPRPLRESITAILAEDPSAAPDVAAQWFYVALCERDLSATARALAAIPASGTAVDLNFPRSWCEALAARVKGDTPAARAAFLVAREEAAKIVREQIDYAPGLTVLGLIDAALGRKQDALREGRHAVELLPVTRDSIDGAEVMKYLAVIYAWCGEKDLALEQIAATLRIPSTLSYGNLKLHPQWDPLRADPRFDKIVAQLAPKKVEK